MKTGQRAIVAACAIAVVAVGIGTWLFIGHAPGHTTQTPSTVAQRSPKTSPAHFVGEQQCAGCHQSEVVAWHGSDHQLAMQVANEKSVLGNFDDATFTYAGTTSTFSRRDGKFIVNTDGPDGTLRDYTISYTFGVRPLQQYLIDFPGGRKQALSIAWDTRTTAQGGQRWFHLYPNDNVKAGDWLHWTNYSQTWNYMCAECHSTDLKKNFDFASNTYKTTWTEIDVSCEACHGPGSNHVAWAHKMGDWYALDATKGLAIALDERHNVVWNPVPATGNAKRSVPRKTTREIDTCARCHARSSRLTDDYIYGKPLLDSHRPVRLDEPLYWTDGQMRAEVYNWGSFLQSNMYSKGVTCSDCHDPHSLQLRAPGNAVCAQCHQPAKYDARTHTHHPKGTPAAACAGCHMPTTTYMVVDPRHDHSIRIPRPDISVTLGTPNACNACHTDKTAQWAADTITTWTKRPPTSFQTFAAAFHAGTIGAPGARDALRSIIDDPNQPALVRASAIDRMAPLLTSEMLDSVTKSLRDPDPNVVLAAVEALANTDPQTRQSLLPSLLRAPVLAVRIEAAHALAGPAEKLLSATDQTDFDRALAEYVAVQRYNADRPEGHMNLGNLYAVRGDPDAAIAQFKQALAIDPLFVGGYANLADVYRSLGGESQAEKVLRDGLQKDPRAAALHYALGLTLARQHRSDEMLAELRKAVLLAPADARFAYVYAVALHDAGHPQDALGVLKTALKPNPYDRDVLLALTYFSAEAGRVDAARGYADELHDLDPHNAEFARLADQFKRAEQP